MLNKVLIFTSPIYSLKITDGGPSGFIAQNILGHDSQVYQLSVNLSIYHKKYTIPYRIARKIRQTFKIPLREDREREDQLSASNLHKVNEFKWWGESSQQHFLDIKAQDYKFIYFHDVWTMKACLPLLSSSQIVILQSHCPELPSEEIASQSYFSKSDIEWSVEAEKDAFARADILIFPNCYVMEIYKPLITSRSKIHYLLSGAKQRDSLHKYPLDDKIHLLYIGRRNYIKGFDIVLEGFKQAYAIRKDIDLILVGRGDKIEEEGIYDIGFTDSVHHWIYNCDYVINCNRQSYFDLSFLETLSIGIPIIASCTSGHQQFTENQSQGIINIGEPKSDNLSQILISSKIRKKVFNQEPLEANQQLYLTQYSDVIYRKNLENLLFGIIQEKMAA
ncbi:glycosyltransferase [Aphanothece sacrum]|uniref:Glycosyl transferase n=1 Tax=Aphanothece sacrum FPU1 TaxID=1920663 RepID=A0A401ID23_APHSA|nr:glycosyltransferase [Aphanothece sacrum]GBF79187.1 glycosyl transferase [Aphanothece sacrum FPU1]GBF86576.1 glycosyl transferase [Aphanothece sacrum FPU3]